MINKLKLQMEQRLVEKKSVITKLANMILVNVNEVIGGTWQVNEDEPLEFVKGSDFEEIIVRVSDRLRNRTEISFDFNDGILKGLSRDYTEKISLSLLRVEEEILIDLGFPLGETQVEGVYTSCEYQNGDSRYAISNTLTCNLYNADAVKHRDSKIRLINMPLTKNNWQSVASVFESLPGDYDILFDDQSLMDWHKEQEERYEKNNCHEWYDYADLTFVGDDKFEFITPTSFREVTVDRREKSISVFFPHQGSSCAAEEILAQANNACVYTVKEYKELKVYKELTVKTPSCS